MKKQMIGLIAGALLALSAGNALAYFEDYELIRVVYNASTGNEMATDLGNVQTLLTTGGTFGGGANAFTTGTNLGASQDANLRVAYIALDMGVAGTSTNVWLSSSAATQANNAAVYTSFAGAAGSAFFAGYGGGYTTPSAQTVASDQLSFQNNFDATPGNFAGYLATISGEASLATLASGSVSQNLFFWANGDVNGNGVNVATILTNADGTTTITPVSNTPIPAAAYLLGSGLLGLFGIRRKQK